MTRSRIRDPLAPLAVMLVVAAGIVLLCTHLVHAAPAVAAATAPPSLLDAIPWQAWIVAGLAALAGLETLLKGLSMILHAIAPRTKTPIDDKLAASVDELHDKVDLARTDLAEIAGALVPAAKPAPAAPIPIAVVPKIGILAVLLLGALALPQVACTAAQVKAEATTAAHDLVNCTGQALGTTPKLDDATLVAVVIAAADEKAKCTPAGAKLDWQCVGKDLESEGKVLGGCALVKLLAGSPPPPASTPGIAARMADDDPGRAALERFRAKVAGGATFHTSMGDF